MNCFTSYKELLKATRVNKYDLRFNKRGNVTTGAGIDELGSLLEHAVPSHILAGGIMETIIFLEAVSS